VNTEEDEVADLVASTAKRLDERLGEITDAMTERLAGIGDISSDPALRVLLRASIEGNLTAIMHLLQNRIPLSQHRLPTAAVAYAERLAQRGVPAHSLVRAYHMGVDDLKASQLEAVRSLDLPPELQLLVIERMNDAVYRYIDRATLDVLAIHEAEQRRWSLFAGNVASATVNRLLAGGEPPPDLTARTGLVLGQQHVGLVLWTRADSDGEDRLSALERAGRELANTLDAAAPLFCAVDLVTAWLWVPRGRRTEPVPPAVVVEALGDVPGGQASLGLPGAGLAGFRRTHRQAQSARELALAGNDPVVAYGDPGVALVSMLAHDVAELRDWVPGVLGALAVDSESTARLRETLLAYLEAGGSPKATAERLHLHRNTVRYRLERVVALLGHDLDEARLDLEVALRCAERLGTQVLVAPD
jgi:hypothetical protein